jgi:hypothetical protein
MDALSIDLTTLVAIWMGGLLILVPLIGMTMRLGLVPLLRAVAELRRGTAGNERLEEQIGGLERRLAMVETTVGVRRRPTAGPR